MEMKYALSLTNLISTNHMVLPVFLVKYYTSLKMKYQDHYPGLQTFLFFSGVHPDQLNLVKVIPIFKERLKKFNL